MLHGDADEDYEERLIMKQINGIGSSAVMEAQLARTSRDSSSVPKAHLVVTKALVAGDSTQLSTTALLIQRNAGAEDIRYEKVAPIKAAIGAGTYSVPASSVADKLMEYMFA